MTKRRGVKTMAKKVKVGRKTKYTKEILWKEVEKYLKKYPNREIKIYILAKESGIHPTTWYRNPDIIKKIDEINATPLSLDIDDDFELPSAHGIVEMCNSNITKLERQIQNLLDLIIQLKRMTDKENINKYKAKITDLETVIKEKDLIIAQLENKLDIEAINGLKTMDNKEAIENFNKISMKDQFKELFD